MLILSLKEEEDDDSEEEEESEGVSKKKKKKKKTKDDDDDDDDKEEVGGDPINKLVFAEDLQPKSENPEDTTNKKVSGTSTHRIVSIMLKREMPHCGVMVNKLVSQLNYYWVESLIVKGVHYW